MCDRPNFIARGSGWQRLRPNVESESFSGREILVSRPFIVVKANVTHIESGPHETNVFMTPNASNCNLPRYLPQLRTGFSSPHHLSCLTIKPPVVAL